MSDIDPTEGLTAEELTEAFAFLDDLRESGITNMFGAAAFVQRDLGWPKQESSSALRLWMRTFDRFKSVAERVKSVREPSNA